MEEKQKTVDQVMLDRMKEIKVETMYDRYEAQIPQCGYGSLALCCRHCNYGPCNIDPFGKGPKKVFAALMLIPLQPDTICV